MTRVRPDSGGADRRCGLGDIPCSLASLYFARRDHGKVIVPAWMGSLRLDRGEAVAAALLRFVSGLRPVPIYGDHCSGFVDRRYRDRRYDLPCICPRSYLGAHIARISRSSRWAANHAVRRRLGAGKRKLLAARSLPNRLLCAFRDFYLRHRLDCRRASIDAAQHKPVPRLGSVVCRRGGRGLAVVPYLSPAISGRAAGRGLLAGEKLQFGGAADIGYLLVHAPDPKGQPAEAAFEHA